MGADHQSSDVRSNGRTSSRRAARDQRVGSGAASEPADWGRRLRMARTAAMIATASSSVAAGLVLMVGGDELSVTGLAPSGLKRDVAVLSARGYHAFGTGQR